MSLLHNHIFLLMLITLLGTALGKINIKSFAFGSSGIIFVALAFGHFGFTLPSDFQTLGLVLFIYSIGLQAGPGFFRSFKSSGIKLTLGTLAVIAVGFLTALAMSLFYGFDASIGAGLFAGALTSTPGLAVGVEMTGSGGAAAAYGLTYFFGVTGVILFIQLLPKLLRICLNDEEKQLDDEVAAANRPMTIMHVAITNPNLFDKKVKDLRLNSIAPIVFTRLLRNDSDKPILVGGDTILKEGDHIRIAGRQKDLDKVQPFLGEVIDSKIQFERVLSRKHILVSKQRVSGMTLRQLNLHEVFNVQVTRLTRNGFDVPATKNLQIHIGDILVAVGNKQALENVSKILGNNVREMYNINLLPIFIGIFLGFLLGKIPLYIPYGGTFNLGTTGGVLISGILLANIYKTGPFTWEIPATANSFIRELGLILFLATVGTKTGANIVDTLSNQGTDLLIAGMAVTLIPLFSSVLICRYLLKLPFLRMLGVMTGAMTSTPGLAAVSGLSNTHYASSAYATVYPVALIGMILFTKLLVILL